MSIRDKIFGSTQRAAQARSAEADTPEDTRGEGSATLADRTAPGGQGSPATNQGKAEPMPSTPGHRDPSAVLEPPLLEDMNVGAADAQRPSLGAASAAPASSAAATASATPLSAPTDLSGPGADPDRLRPVPDTATASGTDTGPENPVQDSPGSSHRAPGLQGSTSPAEELGTDGQASAAAMVADTGRPSGGGDAHGAPVPSESPSPGTSQEHGVVQGARIPDSDH
jgi:hypothetical protein